MTVYLDQREHSVGSFNALGKGDPRPLQNHAHGDGGTCGGDSGGPNFFGAGASETNMIAATTVTGDPWCKSTNVDQRVDTAASRAFLGDTSRFPRSLRLPHPAAMTFAPSRRLFTR